MATQDVSARRIPADPASLSAIVRKWPHHRREYAMAFVAALASFVAAFVVLHLWHADLRIPLFYADGGDVTNTAATIKAMAENGWYLHSAYQGAPFGADSGQIPLVASLHLLVIAVLLFLTRNFAIALNLFFLFTFVATGAIAYLALRNAKIARGTALAVSVLYSILPYRFMRNEAHLFYAAFYLVPLAVLLALWLARGKNILDVDLVDRRPRIRVGRRGWIALAICVLIGCDNQYDAIFSILLFLIAVAAGVRRRTLKRTALAALAMCAVIVVVVQLQLLPAKLFAVQHPEFAGNSYHREPAAAEQYGLTLAQLVLPIPNDRIASLAAVRSFYDVQFPPIANENGSVSLGIVGTVGFLLSLLALARGAAGARRSLAVTAAVLNVGCILFATVGGFGAIFSYYVTDDIRAYNRIAPFVAFISFATLASAIDRLVERLALPASKVRFVYAGLALLVLVGAYDQTSPVYVPRYALNTAVYAAQQRYIDRIASALPDRAQVYELPYVRFPESPPVVNLGASDELLPYLHSSTIDWSFGAPENTASGRWQSRYAADPIEVLTTKLAIAGFKGVLLMRDGYADHGKIEEAAIVKKTGSSMITSEDGAWSFFNIAKFAAAVARVPKFDMTAARDTVLFPVSVESPKGCGDLRLDATGPYYFCGNDVTVYLDNPSTVTKSVHLGLAVVKTVASDRPVTILGPTGPVSYSGNLPGNAYSADFDVPPGRLPITISTEAEALPDGTDPQPHVFLLRGLTMSDHALDRLDARIAAGAG